MSTLTIHEGFNPNTGIETKTHFEDGAIVIQKSFDAQPYLEYAKAARDATTGMRWGNGRIVGTIPPAFHAELILIRDPEERKRRVRKFFQDNPDFKMFDRYGK